MVIYMGIPTFAILVNHEKVDPAPRNPGLFPAHFLLVLPCRLQSAHGCRTTRAGGSVRTGSLWKPQCHRLSQLCSLHPSSELGAAVPGRSLGVQPGPRFSQDLRCCLDPTLRPGLMGVLPERQPATRCYGHFSPTACGPEHGTDLVRQCAEGSHPFVQCHTKSPKFRRTQERAGTSESWSRACP